MATPTLAPRPQPQHRNSSPALGSRRQSTLSSSSVASYQTARTDSAGSPYISSTNIRSSDNINPLHSYQGGVGIHEQEVHIMKVTTDTVHIKAGPIQETFFQKVAHHLPHKEEHITYIQGPPPPSPPASIEEIEIGQLETDVTMTPPRLVSSRSDHVPRFGSPEQNHDLPPIPRSTAPAEYTTLPTVDSKVALSSLRQRQAGNVNRHEDQAESSSMASGSQARRAAHHLSTDGYLHPQTAYRAPARRNTTGSSPKAASSSRHGMTASQPEGDPDVELASDIQLAAEQIRKERQNKRAKAQQEAEAALTAPTYSRSKTYTNEPNNVLVGNLIGEDHVNYVLMYNMLTGIRIGVSRCQAKIKRPLTDDDFKAKHKFSFDIVGNELTPSAKYDFKFKDYAPWVFRELREDHFQLDPADYLLSLTAKYILSELGSPGKSGSFFYFSRDYRFIIKTIRHSEAKFLLSILKEYHAHIKSNPQTLLSRFYGLHRVKLPRGRKIHFVIMNNLFPAHRDIHETYDLKGSTVGREYSEEKAAANPQAVLKDLNWINRDRQLDLGPEKRALLQEQLRRDAEFLQDIHVMDYSLLVGIHNMHRGNRDNVRRNTLKVFAPDMPPMSRKATLAKGNQSPEVIAMRRAMRESDPKRLGKDTIRLPESDTGDKQQFLFYQDEGGLQATDEANEPMNTVYYLGVIDILTPYSVVKKLEHFWKGLSADRHKISPVQPTEYADRFFSFMKAIMRGGGGGARFKAE